MDELQISGKRFISAKRIARENSYTSDYVGQLIRGGKVVGQKVGRAWYVDAESFDKYLGGEAAVIVPAEVKREPEPAPAVEAAIEKKSVVVEAPAPEPTPAIVEKVIEPEEVVVPVRVMPQPTAVKKAEPTKVSGLRYYQEDAPALPEIYSYKTEYRVAPAQEVEEESVETRTAEVFVAHEKKSRPLMSAAVFAALALAVLAGSAWLSSRVSLNLSVSEGNTASASYGITK